MPSPKLKSKPTLSMSRPKLDLDAAEAFVRGSELPTSSSSSAPKLVEVVEDDATAATEDLSVAELAPPKMPSKPRTKRTQAVDASAPRGIVTRSSGRKVRRRVVYLPPNIDKELAIAAAVRGVDVSEVVADLLRQHL